MQDRKPIGALDVFAHAQHARRLGRDRLVVTGNHLHLILFSAQNLSKIPP